MTPLPLPSRAIRRAGRVVLATGVLVAALLGSVVGSLAGSAPAAAQSTASGSEGCSRVDVLLLVDTSASLRNTDPQGQRVAAAEVLLRSLASSAQAGGTTVDVTVASF